MTLGDVNRIRLPSAAFVPLCMHHPVRDVRGRHNETQMSGYLHQAASWPKARSMREQRAEARTFA